MKVLFLGRTGLLDNMGGDRIQIENTAEELRKLGVSVDIKTGSKVDVLGYDLVHIFQLDWNPDCYFQQVLAKKANIPIIFSPIHHNIDEVKKFDDEFVFDFRRISKVLFKDQFSRDLFKEFYRACFNPTRMYPVIFSVFKGLRNMYRAVLLNSSAVLVQTDGEIRDLKKTFDIEFKSYKVCNGVSAQFLDVSQVTNPLNFENYIICVGRIEPRKNQLNVIKALSELRQEKKLECNLVIIGSKAKKKHFEYTSLIDALIHANSWIKYIEKVPYQDIPAYYKYAKVGVSASWFETTGLTSLEALLCGTNAVAAGDRAKEYLGDFASYCKPEDISSIKSAILTEFAKPRPEIPVQLKEEYTWKNAAEKTREIYDMVLSNK